MFTVGCMHRIIQLQTHEHIQLENSLNNDLCKLRKYFDVNRLSINVAKCVFMLIGTYQALQKMLDIRVHIDNEPLKRVSVAKYISMYIDENLRATKLISAYCPRANRNPIYKKSRLVISSTQKGFS